MGYNKEQMIGIAAFCVALPAISVALRVWAKLIRAGLSLDDYLIFPALLFCIGGCICQFVGTIYGRMGQHQPLTAEGLPILDGKFEVFENCKFALQIVSILGLGFTKASILVLYKNLFQINRTFKMVIKIMLLFVVGWVIAFLLPSIFQCKPVTTLVEPFYGNNCINTLPFYLALSVTDGVMDVAILILPMPMVWQLKLTTRTKVAVTGMFLLGAITCAASVARLVVFFQIVHDLSIYGPDITYYTSPSAFWTLIEQCLAIVSACLPTLRPLFMRHDRSGTNISYGGASYGQKSVESRYRRGGYRLSDPTTDAEAAYRLNTFVKHDQSREMIHNGPGIKVQKDISYKSSETSL